MTESWTGPERRSDDRVMAAAIEAFGVKVEGATAAMLEVARSNDEANRRKWVFNSAMLIGIVVLVIVSLGRQSSLSTERTQQFEWLRDQATCQSTLQGNWYVASTHVIMLDVRSFSQAEPKPTAEEYLAATAELSRASSLLGQMAALCSGDHPDRTPLDGDPTR